MRSIRPRFLFKFTYSAKCSSSMPYICNTHHLATMSCSTCPFLNVNASFCALNLTSWAIQHRRAHCLVNCGLQLCIHRNIGQHSEHWWYWQALVFMGSPLLCCSGGDAMPKTRDSFPISIEFCCSVCVYRPKSNREQYKRINQRTCLYWRDPLRPAPANG